VAWIIEFLIQDVGTPGALSALLGLVAVGFAVWIYGRTQAIGPRGRHLGAGLAAAGIAAALILAATLALPGELAREAATAEQDDFGYQQFSRVRLSELVAEHRPVFVNLTAAWCLTCLVNEHTALATQAVRRAFAEHRIVALKADWTRQNPEITTFLQEFGRNGVPLYLLYDKAGTPTILPQILTEAGVLAAVGNI